MSSFFGIFRPQGGPVDLESFEDMRKASYREGFDGMETHVVDKIAMGHLMLRVSPEDEYDRQPLKSSCGRYLMVGHFRLDYRDELGDKIGLTQSQLEKTPDSTLAMMAFQKWAEKCVNHIQGDWIFIVYDSIQTTLSLFKDRFGASALFYGKVNHDFIFSTDPFIFIRIKHKFFFDMNRNAIYRECVEGLKHEVGETFLKNIFSLEASTFLEINESISIRKVNYYKIQFKRIKFSFNVDYVLQFHSLVYISVRNRLRASNIGIFLSAGLDSSMVAYFAAKELEYKKQRLLSFTSCPYNIDHIPIEKLKRINERSYVEKYILRFNNIDSHFLCFPNFGFFDFLNSRKSENILDPVISPNSFWLDGINKAAREYGVQLMLNGQMGNYVVSWNAPFSSLDNLFHLRILELFKTFNYLKLCKRVGIFRFILTELVKPFLILMKNKKNRINYLLCKNTLHSSFFNPIKGKLKVDFSSQFHHRFYTQIAPKKLRLLLFNSTISSVAQKWYCQASEHRILSADPFTDIQLVEYSFSIPEHFYNLHGDKKFMYKTLMQGVINNTTLLEVSGIPQSYDIGRRVLSDKSLINSLENILEIDFMSDYFDYESIKKILTEFELANKDSELNRLSKELLKFISLQLFITKFAVQRHIN